MTLKRERQKWSRDGNTLLRCNGDCGCHWCCIPYMGEAGPHCENCEPEDIYE